MPGAVVLGMDLANFYLNTPMPNPEYMHLRLDVIPEEIIVAYNLTILPTGWSISQFTRVCMVSPKPVS